MVKELVESVHYYLENGKVVFLPFYHIERGKCCGNKCRHCPFNPEWTKDTTELKDEFKREYFKFDKTQL
jgi:2-iminoacetate synthase ThiH